VRETKRHRDAFEVWYSANRNSVPVQERFRVSERSALLWSALFQWHARADERDAEAARQANEEAIRSRVQRLKEHQQAGELLRRRGVLYFSARNEKGGWQNEILEPTPAIRAIKEGIAIERQAEGMPDYLIRVLTMSEDELKADLARTDRLAAALADAPALAGADELDSEGEWTSERAGPADLPAEDAEAGSLLPPEAFSEAADLPEPDV
jgi:hypothetical protein